MNPVACSHKDTYSKNMFSGNVPISNGNKRIPTEEQDRGNSAECSSTVLNTISGSSQETNMSSDEQVSTSKFTICIITVQFGKTYTAISKMTIDLQEDAKYGRSINIVYTMNTLLNNEQFSSRLHEIEKKYSEEYITEKNPKGKGAICVLSSSYNGPYEHATNITEILGKCFSSKTTPRVIIMCSNNTRYDDGVDLIEKINDMKPPHIRRAHLYFDEIHKYLTEDLRKKIEKIHDLDIVKTIVGLTATPAKVFQPTGFWSKLHQIKIPNYNDEDYAGFNEKRFHAVDDFDQGDHSRKTGRSTLSDTTIEFADYALHKHPGILAENTLTFMPAHTLCVGHTQMKEMIFRHNSQSVVVVINGKEKMLEYKDSFGKTKTLSLVPPKKKRLANPDFDNAEIEEACKTIYRLVKDNKLEKRPIVITGFICVSMGQTLTCRELGAFTSAIVSHLDLSNDDIYQLVGRINGRMLNWGDKYVKTNVYCPTIVRHRCEAMEQCARNMAIEHNDEFVTIENYFEPISKMGIEFGQSIMNNMDISGGSSTGGGRAKDNRTTVPIVLSVSPEEYSSMRKTKRTWIEESIFAVIQKYRPELVAQLKTLTRLQITENQNNTLDNYKKRITDFVNAFELNRPFTLGTGAKVVNQKDVYQIFLDKFQHRIIITIYYGSRSKS